jgi:hypothetical protein
LSSARQDILPGVPATGTNAEHIEKLKNEAAKAISVGSTADAAAEVLEPDAKPPKGNKRKPSPPAGASASSMPKEKAQKQQNGAPDA